MFDWMRDGVLLIIFLSVALLVAKFLVSVYL